MKKLIIGGMVAVALLVSPVAPAQAQVLTASSTVVVQSDLDTLRSQLIALLLQLVSQLQAQLDEQSKVNEAQDVQIEEVKTSVRSTSSGSSKTVMEEEVVDDIDYEADARKKLGTTEASIWVDREEEPYLSYLSIVNYLETDTLNVNTNDAALEVSRACDVTIVDNPIKGCSYYATYTATTTDLVIDMSINGEKRTIISDVNSRLVRTNW